jgi:hypothetical protein
MLQTTLNTSQRTIFTKFKRVKEMRKVDYLVAEVDKSPMLEVLCLMRRKRRMKEKETLWEEADFSTIKMKLKTTLI